MTQVSSGSQSVLRLVAASLAPQPRVRRALDDLRLLNENDYHNGVHLPPAQRNRENREYLRSCEPAPPPAPPRYP